MNTFLLIDEYIGRVMLDFMVAQVFGFLLFVADGWLRMRIRGHL